MGMMRSLLDILLAAYGFTKNTFPDIQKQQIIDTTINYLTSNWGNSANTLAKQKLED